MPLEGYRSHFETVATPARPAQTFNVSMPEGEVQLDLLA